MEKRLKEIISEIHPVNKTLTITAFERINRLTKPVGSLGRLEEVAAKLFAIYNGDMPDSLKKVVYVFAADHGITEEGVSAYPRDVTYQMVFNFLRGGAAINVFAKAVGAKVYVVDVGVDYKFEKHSSLLIKKIKHGTMNFLKSSAMNIDDALKSIFAGFDVASDAVKKGFNLLAPGDMGIGNTTSSSAILKAITGYDTEKLVGYGTGIDEKTVNRKIKTVDTAISIHKPDGKDALDILHKVGGFEIGAICGFILGAAFHKKPVVIDGFISAAGFSLAWLLNKNVLDYAIFSHCSKERGHKLFFEYIKQKPLFDLDLRLGEGTGAVLSFTTIEAALKMFNEMATFEEANVSEKRL